MYNRDIRVALVNGPELNMFLKIVQDTHTVMR